MSIITKPFYLAKCDRCGEEADYEDFSAWSDPNGATEYLSEDWVTIQGKDGELHYCPSCTVWSEDEDQFVVAPEPAESNEDGS